MGTRRKSITVGLVVMLLWIAACSASAPTKAPIVTVLPSIPVPATYATCTTTNAPTIPLTVALTGAGQANLTAIGTTIYGLDQLLPTQGPVPQVAWQLLDQWHPAMVRLHFGFYGGQPALPENQQGVWDFSQDDQLIAALRTHGIPFYLDVRTGPPWMFTNTGQLRDQSFQEFATYMARLVGWYNKGGFTDDQGQFHSSGHQNWIHTWEIWNEPNSGYEVPAPVANRAATWMEAVPFARLYDTTVAAMRAVDPTILTGGPTLSSYPDIPYLRAFVQAVQQPLDFLSFHAYAISNTADPDQNIFTALNGPRLLQRLIAAKQLLAARYPGKHVPIWIDELGLNEVSRPPADPRGTEPIAYAFNAAVYAIFAQQGIDYFGQFPLVGTNQLALIDYKTAQIYRTYWFFLLLARAFPVGSTLYPLSGPDGDGIVGLAAIAPDGQSLRVMIGNSQVAHPADHDGSGVPVMIHLTLSSAAGNPLNTGNVGTTWNFDASAPTDGLPTPCIQNTQRVNATSTSLTFAVGGYGATFIDIPLVKASNR